MTQPRIFGDPYETPDGTTVIPVHRPVGVFAVREGQVKWEPAVDATRVALLGLGIGLAAAVLTGLAMVHRPPWPDVRLRY
ncbi:hypothetical protein [Amycolatopsis sp. NPDC021455]|uniref:hypothetical protein n=1 Tax=Amycolatopsis sp. NPDC021455 TaxID=3154901 RepID=UPI0033D2160D